MVGVSARAQHEARSVSLYRFLYSTCYHGFYCGIFHLLHASRQLTLRLANRMVSVDLARNTNGNKLRVRLQLSPTKSHTVQHYTAILNTVIDYCSCTTFVFKKRPLSLEDFLNFSIIDVPQNDLFPFFIPAKTLNINIQCKYRITEIHSCIHSQMLSISIPATRPYVTHTLSTLDVITLQRCMNDCAQAIKNLAVISVAQVAPWPRQLIYFFTHCCSTKGQQTKRSLPIIKKKKKISDIISRAQTVILMYFIQHDEIFWFV